MRNRERQMRSAAVTAAARKRFEATRSVFLMVFSTCRIPQTCNHNIFRAIGFQLAKYAEMALVTITGFPCSGKSTRAQQLKRDFEKRLKEPEYDGPALEVVVVDDESSHVPRSTYDCMCYLSVTAGGLFWLISTQPALRKNQAVQACSPMSTARWGQTPSPLWTPPTT